MSRHKMSALVLSVMKMKKNTQSIYPKNVVKKNMLEERNVVIKNFNRYV